MNRTAQIQGKLGLPSSIQTLASKKWDAIVVGAGHNGLVCAAYLARAGKKVLVLEARERVGGACTLEDLMPGVQVSPCAYVVGLLHQKVIDELGMKKAGFRWIPASGGTFIPFDDGSSLQLWLDDEKCAAEVKAFAPDDYAGWKEMKALVRRTRDLVRPAGDRDMWLNRAPTPEEMDERLGNDTEARALLFDWSMVELVERYLKDERFQMAYLGQGVIGTNASPSAKGTASIYFHHTSGRLDGNPGTWGYVEGGMGKISFILCDIAQDLGATIATGVPVARILPGEGVELEGGERIVAPVVVSNADPRTTLRMLGRNADPEWKAKVESIPMKGCSVKVNLVVKELPNFRCRPGTLEPHHYGQINTSLSKADFHASWVKAANGEVADRLWTEIYLQTPHDPSIAPAGMHTMTIFSQYAPYEFKSGTWDTRREEVGDKVVASIARYCSNLPDAIVHREVLGPPDVEKKVGLSGGHIFQGDILPGQMWWNRLSAQTPMKGVYLCGAGTFPGGSVMGINGRNAAFESLTAED